MDNIENIDGYIDTSKGDHTKNKQIKEYSKNKALTLHQLSQRYFIF